MLFCLFIWKLEVLLCYNNVEEIYKWFEGNIMCINSGGCLVILNIYEKFMVVLNGKKYIYLFFVCIIIKFFFFLCVFSLFKYLLIIFFLIY